ncbi:MAG: cation transporting ATPase C-terminal domain-containing protein, partial [Proteiniphilum sp.]|nr:cation transporting ATPase C-terminal domain-containing protein [Proteiniphilum sp.]
KPLLGAIFLSTLLLLLVLLIPGVMFVFGVVEMDSTHWLYVVGLSLLPIVIVELMKLFKINHSRDEY